MTRLVEYRFRSKQQGVGLVEVLVALMVFSMGMLGIASLQIITKRSSFEAQQRQEAVLIANDMISRIKNSGLTPVQIKTSFDGQDFSAASTPNTPTTNCLTSDCTVGQLVAYDLFSWHKNIYGSSVSVGSGLSAKNVSGLTSAKGCIDVSEVSSKTTKVTVTVAWLSMSGMSGSKTRACSIDSSSKQREVSIKTFI